MFIKISKRTILLSVLSAFSPDYLFAKGVGDIIDAGYFIVSDILIYLAFALALFYFFWGVAKYIRSGAAGEKAAEEGRRTLVWGVVAIFIAFSIFGIVSFIKKELNIGDASNINSTIRFEEGVNGGEGGGSGGEQGEYGQEAI